MAVHPIISDVDGFVDRLISASGLDENDRDIGTSGLCATFALVLYRCLARVGINSTIAFLCCTGANGKLLYTRGHQGDLTQVYWRHALVRVGSVFFDVDGRVKIHDAVENYCWGPGVEGALPVDVSPGQAIALIRGEENAYDVRYRNIWVKKLKQGIEILDRETPVGPPPEIDPRPR